MKKILSILLVMTMMLTLLMMPAYAYDTSDCKYFDKFVEYFGREPWKYYYYEEPCYYYTNEGDEEPAWALVTVVVRVEWWPFLQGIQVGDRILFGECWQCDESPSGYFVYVKESDTFIPLVEDEMENIIELCPDFVETIEENEVGVLIGDVNRNDVLDINDVTEIQRYLANCYIVNIDHEVEVYGSIDIVDYNRDGVNNILDATMLQRHLARLDV